jgi:predicted metalloprotease
VSEFLRVVLGSTEDAWGTLFQRSGSSYPQPQLVLFSGSVPSACGFNTAATGPFYCPADRRLYLDTSFFSQLQRMGAGGDFAIAYVVGHEVGHHVQNVEGTLGQVQRAQQQASGARANQISVATELQADCYAGVWARFAQGQNLLEPGDLEEGLQAAAAVGDDRLTGGSVRPESFTHGTSEQRASWFRRGYESGDPASCDTFG